MRSVRRVIGLERRHINYVRSTVESYGGLAVVRTLDPHGASIELLISPGCEGLVSKLLESLTKDDGIVLVPVETPRGELPQASGHGGDES